MSKLSQVSRVLMQFAKLSFGGGANNDGTRSTNLRRHDIMFLMVKLRKRMGRQIEVVSNCESVDQAHFLGEARW